MAADEIKVLNNDVADLDEVVSLPSSASISPIELSKQLFQTILRLKGKFLNELGKLDYEQLRQSSEFREFEIGTRQLANVNLRTISNGDKNERKAFFLNIYNTLTIHAMSRCVTHEKDVIELKGFWQSNAYRIGNFIFSLDDIEHGILRCNRIHPTTKEHFFKEGDLRQEFIETGLDPRIHFALNCGAKSCPPIRLFSGDNIEKLLDMATQNFCQNDIAIDSREKSVSCSKIFMWYGEDFGKDEISILKWISKFLSDEQAKILTPFLESGDFEMKYGDYDWSII